MKDKDTDRKHRNQGEGDYDAGRHYDEATKRFVKDGKVAPAARKAEPHSDAEQREMQQAERTGQSHSKGEDQPTPGVPPSQ